MADTAKDQVRSILAETRRRKRIWGEMQEAAREAMTAVTAVARRRGVRGQKWIGGQFDLEYTYVSFPTFEARLDEAIHAKNPRTTTHDLRIHGSGTLERHSKGDAYEGYPDLGDDDPAHFREAAVCRLMASLNTYIQRQGGRRGRRR